MSSSENQSGQRVSRRTALTRAAGIGAVATAAASADESAEESVFELNEEALAESQWLAGLELTDEQRTQAVRSVKRMQSYQAALRAVDIGYDDLPAFRFDPEMFDPDVKARSQQSPAWLSPGLAVLSHTVSAPPAAAGDDAAEADAASTSDCDETSAPQASDAPVSVTTPVDPYAFLPIRTLGRLLRSKEVTAVQLAEGCLQRLRASDPALKCVVNLTEELALQQARRADEELAAGQDRGPLHGIPWGAKDLIAVEGYPTTWGAPQFEDQVLPRTAPVARRLEEAGAVLVAKLSLGALAMGDKWFGGMTRNPWNIEQGSSGSSAGPASAVAAGLVPFALGSETLGSIVSPSKRCGTTGLRPTFGRVTRKDCMALSWSMDKIGPMARSIDDCGLVFRAICGAESGDPTTVDRWFDWPMQADLSKLRIGRVEGVRTSREDEITLNTLEELGATIVPVKLPTGLPVWQTCLMLDVEAGTIFHDLVADQNDAGLNTWPNTFRTAHYVSSVDFVRAARVRSKLMQQMVAVFADVDLYVGGGDLGIANLTGHPTVVFPTRISDTDHPQPRCSTLTGRLHDEATLLAIARLVESKLDLLGYKPDFSWLKANDTATDE